MMNELSGCVEKIDLLVSKIRSLDSREEALKMIVEVSERRRAVILSFVNAHAVNMALDKIDFYNALLSSDILLRDGVGLELLMSAMNRQPGCNLNGTDFIADVLALYGERRGKILLLGTREPYLTKAKEKIRELGLDIVGCIDGYHDEQQYLCLAEKMPCDLILLGMGMPKQECVAQLLKQKLTSRCLIVNGGAMIDFLGGKVSRAPLLVQRVRCEWLYRLACEPKRLLRRYLLGGFVFLFHVLRVKANHYKTKF